MPPVTLVNETVTEIIRHYPPQVDAAAQMTETIMSLLPWSFGLALLGIIISFIAPLFRNSGVIE